jgi:hypothetical protein
MTLAEDMCCCDPQGQSSSARAPRQGLVAVASASDGWSAGQGQAELKARSCFAPLLRRAEHTRIRIRARRSPESGAGSRQSDQTIHW